MFPAIIPSPSVSTPVVSFFNATPALFTILPASSALSFIIKFPPLFIVYVSFTPVIVFPFILRVISCPSNTSTLSFVSVTISIVHWLLGHAFIALSSELKLSYKFSSSNSLFSLPIILATIFSSVLTVISFASLKFPATSSAITFIL